MSFLFKNRIVGFCKNEKKIKRIIKYDVLYKSLFIICILNSCSGDSTSLESTTSPNTPENVAPNPENIDPFSSRVENGWTTLEASVDSRKIYVSNSEGDDSNDGLSPEFPKKTAEAGIELLRNNMPDWLLFKKGDSWPEIGHWSISGRSNEELMVITSYGEGLNRPEFSKGISVFGNNKTVSNVAFVGLSVAPKARNPKNPTNTDTVKGILWLSGANNILFEDCYFQWTGLSFQDEGMGINNITFRRTHFLDAYSVTGHAQGIFLQGVTNFTLDECIFDHNGWAEELSEAEPTQFNHNIYYQYGSDESFTIKNSILSRGSSHGMQLRSGGRVENNLFMENAINILIGSGNTDNNIGGVTGWVIDNVILDASDIRPRQGHPNDPMLRGWALSFENLKEITVTGNIASNAIGGFSSGLMTGMPGPHSGGDPNITMSKNITIGYREGENHNHTTPFIDSSRNISTYMNHLGLSGGLEEFMIEARKNQKGNWRIEFTAEKVNEYIREGFKTL